MHPLLARIVEHLKTKRTDGTDDMPAVIKECAADGFPAGIIIAGIQHVHLIPHDEAKKLVATHLFNDNARTELDQFHSKLESALLDSDDSTR